MRVEGYELAQRQSLPLELKELMTARRIRDWYEYWDGDVYVAFSGGKDSTVLLHQVRKLYPDVPAVFHDTGLEYPEIRSFVKRFDNVVWDKPKKKFREVIETYGYPVVSKDVSQKIYQIRNTKSDTLRNINLYGYPSTGGFKLPNKWHYLLNAPFKISCNCCGVMKKSLAKCYERKSGRKGIIGVMASDSMQRKVSYMQTGCNSFESRRPQSKPMSFWLEQDVWDYIHKYNIPYSAIYDMGYTRTGCMFCMFGVHMEDEPNRFQLMSITHPKLHDYCINKLGCGKVLDYLNVKYEV